MSVRLEQQSERKLPEPPFVVAAIVCECAEAALFPVDFYRACREVGRICSEPIHIHIVMVEDVERLGAELEFHTLRHGN